MEGSTIHIKSFDMWTLKPKCVLLGVEWLHAPFCAVTFVFVVSGKSIPYTKLSGRGGLSSSSCSFPFPAGKIWFDGFILDAVFLGAPCLFDLTPPEQCHHYHLLVAATNCLISWLLHCCSCPLCVFQPHVPQRRD